MKARDDYPYKKTIAAQRAQHDQMCDEIDRLRMVVSAMDDVLYEAREYLKPAPP